MSWVTVIWSMVASACLTLALIYFLVWCRNRKGWAQLLFSLTAASTTAFAFCELAMMRAQTPADLVTAMRWAQLTMFVWLVSITWFVKIYLRAGRPWLAWTITGLRAFYLALTFLAGINVNYLTVSSLRPIQFLGESVSVIEGVPNPLTLFGQSVVVLVLIFVADASVTAWRRGDRRKARMVGGSAEFFLLAGLVTSSAVFWGYVQAPIVVSLCYLGLIVVMGYELSRDLLRASQLVRQLQVSEAQLRESEARMTLAVDAAELGIWIQELPGTEVWASDRWREMSGFAPSEPLCVEATFSRVHPDDRDWLKHAHGLAVAGAEGARYQAEYRIMLPNGETRWILASGRLERDALGQPVRIRSVCREITSRKRADQETQLLRQEIAHAGRVSMMGQLASSLAHEINQPLAAILVNTAAAERFLARPAPDVGEVRAILSDIRRDDERAGAIIDRMRAFLKRHEIESRRLDVAALVYEVVALLRPDAAARQVKLDVHVPAGLPEVWGDRVHVQQVLLNLILNGMDAVDGASVEQRRIKVAAGLESGQTVEICVDDLGPGIPEDALAQIFEPFFTTKPDSLGMGLAISRTIIDAHGGQLWAENRKEGGAAFRFTLPTAEAFEPAMTARTHHR